MIHWALFHATLSIKFKNLDNGFLNFLKFLFWGLLLLK